MFLFTVNANAAFIPIPSAPINYYAVGVLGKGELLTSDGTSNGTQAACADDELLVWDAAEVSGVKCAAAPSGGSGPAVTSSGNFTVTTYPTSETVALTFSSVTVTAGAVVNVMTTYGKTAATPGLEFNSWASVGGSACIMSLYRDAVLVGRAEIFNNNAGNIVVPAPNFVDVPSADGSYVYTIRIRRFSGSNCGNYAPIEYTLITN